MDESARSLGEGAGGILRRVHLPLLHGSLLTAALLRVFVDVMKELPATLVMRPFNFDTLATQAIRWRPMNGWAKRPPRWRSSRSACCR